MKEQEAERLWKEFFILNNSEDVVRATVKYQLNCAESETDVPTLLPREHTRICLPSDAKMIFFTMLADNRKLGWTPFTSISEDRLQDNRIVITGEAGQQKVSTPEGQPDNSGSFIFYSISLKTGVRGLVKLWVHYSLGGKAYVKNSGGVTSGDKSFVYIPKEGTDIFAEVKLWYIISWKQIYSESLKQNRPNCYYVATNKTGYHVDKINCELQFESQGEPQ